MVLMTVTICGLNACGGGGGGDDASTLSSVAPTWVQGNFPASSTLAAKCAAPRTGTDPATGRAYVDTRGSVTSENFWLRSWTHETYLWYSEVVDRNPASYTSPLDYFETQKTTATTSSGKDKDQFHFTYTTEEWNALSQSGVAAGYGVGWAFISNTPPRILKVADIEPNSPASNAALTRGEKVLAIDNVNIDDNTSAGVDTLNAGLSPTSGATHSFLILALNGTQRTVSMTAANVTSIPVKNVKTLVSGAVGYLLFNSHVATSEQLLINAFTTLKQANVTDLVLDIRYNGGGYLDIASEVAYMIAGSNATNGRVFERTVFNNQYASTVNPITGGSNTPVPFHSTSSSGAALPTLNLPRVFVLTGAGTCSASESIINGLRGVGVTVVQIGNTTCGKPYGFYAQDNCGTTYFSIQFKGVNNANFGDYADGFSPSSGSNGIGVPLPGCTVADDFNHALGDPLENRLAAALYYRTNNSCSPSISVDVPTQRQVQSVTTGQPLDLPSNPWRENRILTAPNAP
jgi:C-terminal processing protease CtpA/Prc